MASRKSKKAPDVLSAAYLERASGKSELLSRLTNVTETLSTLSEDIDPSTHPGLLSLSTTLVSPSIIGHRDKEVRLNAVLACCELFYIYAPEPPWAECEILEIFNQLVRQLGNLHNVEPTSNMFDKYYRILEQLSEVKIGVVLVDLIRTERGTSRKSSGGKRGSTGGEENDALETLCDLIRTLLTCVNLDHPPEVAAHAELAVAACIEEFEGNIPIQVLEELLTCVGQGPVVWVTNPAFAGSKKRKSSGGSSEKKGGSKDGELPPAQIQQTNPSYLVAAKVLRRTEDKISSPIAALLNGLLTGDSHVMGQTSLSTIDAEAATLFAAPKGKKGKKKGADKDESPTLATHLAPKESSPGANVYSISYELHRIAPQILTTVIGTVSTSLQNADLAKRWQATKLLGRLFGARNSDIASRFGPCFREWVRRSYDPEPKIRETMVKCLANFLTTQYTQTELCAEVNEGLAAIILRDPILEIRLLGIHQVCDLAHSAVVSSNGSTASEVAPPPSSKRSPPISIITPELLQAVGNRVSSKNKTEHKDAVTGLAQIYHKHYIRQKLHYVQEGGEDVSIDEILDVWKDLKAARGKNADQSEDEEKFAWIPQRVFECVSYSDSTDADMRSRIFQIVDDVLLGTTKKEGSTLSPTSRAVGLAIILDSIKDKDNAYRWMCTLFTQRSNLQKALGVYLDARSKAKEFESGSAEAFTADSEAMEKLELVASLSAPLPENKSPSSGSSADLESILKKVHSAKDKHIFRILSTISSPAHSPSARLRAFDELPKRTKGLGNAAQSWIKTLAKRCAMGAFLNAEAIEHCIILSQECFEAENCEVASAFLECVKVATSIFPALGATKEGFEHLVEFFDASRTTSNLSANIKKGMEKYGVVTTLSEILARCGGHPSSPGGSGKRKDDDDSLDFEDNTSSYDTLREQLLRLCTRDGTPEQARNSIYTLKSGLGGGGTLSSRISKEKQEFEPLLKALVNPSRLAIPDDTTNPKNQGRIVSILSAIAAIAECAPYAFNASGEGSKLGWGQRAIEFALDTVLLGKNTMLNASVDDEDSSDSDDDDENLSSPVKKGRSSKTTKNKSKSKGPVSIHCQMLCGAIEVLVSHIRSTIVHSQHKSSESGAPKLKPPSSDHLEEVFGTLTKIIEDGGVPPSSVNGRYCKTTKDQAELRRSAAVNLLRLCDANMKLEAKYLTPRMWHILSSSLLDKDKSVRSSVIEELCAMYTGSGKFRAHGAQPVAPSLRFVSLVTLCADGDGTGGQHSAANAGAANVGKKTGSVKNAATSLIKQLRTTVQTLQAQVRANGRSAEKNFESNLKMLLMPEYSVPYALHLLAFRHETASAAGTLAGENESESENEEMADGGDEELVHTQEASQKMLKKRLKWLFDPLIQSLGAGADNISFLMRMVELIGKHPPVNVLKTSVDVSTLGMSLGDEDDADIYGNDVDEKEAMARMKIICQFAREVLLSHVKSDHNLTVYPGSISFPATLFSRRLSTSPVRKYEESAIKERRPKKSIGDYVTKQKDEDDMSENESKPEEGDEYSSKKSESEDNNSIDDEKSKDSVHEQKKEDTFEHSPSASASPFSSDNDGGGGDFANDFGDVSPISKAESPAVDASAPKGRTKKRSSAVSAKVKAKPTKQSKTSSKNASSTKNKKRKIDVFDEFLSPETDGGDSDAASESPAPARGKSSSAKKPRKSTPSTKTTSAKKKVRGSTPVSVPKQIRLKSIDPNSASSGSTAPSKKKGAATKKKKQVVAKKVKKSAIAVEKKDVLDFSDSPVKPKASAAGRSRKNSASSAKKAPAKKVSKAKVSVGASKAKVTKAKVAAGKRSSGGRGKTQVSASSPSTTSEASSKASPRRSARKSTRVR